MGSRAHMAMPILFVEKRTAHPALPSLLQNFGIFGWNTASNTFSERLETHALSTA